MTVAVVKLGVGNTASVMFALDRLGAGAVLTDDPGTIANAERVILPGVGSAAHASARLRERGLSEVLRAFRRPLLGICLGQQLLFARSEEGDAEGLAFFDGEVTRLPASPRTPAPHMGWSRFTATRAHPLLEGLTAAPYAYFVHSYVCPIGADTIATATYGKPFAAIVARGAVMGCQFHPERSGAVGARVLGNFLDLPC